MTKKKKPVRKRARKFSDEIWLCAKKMFVEEGKTAVKISRKKGMPSEGSLSKAINEKGDDKKTWRDERKEFINKKYERLSPSARAEKLLDKLDELLCSKDMDMGGFADAVKKMSATLRELSDPLFILPIRLEALRDFCEYAMAKESRLLSDKFRDLVQDFKDKLVDNAHNAAR
jgi:transposase-like protein